MRAALFLAPLLLITAPAIAEPLSVAKGMWSTTSDIYFNVQADGEVLDIPPEHSSLEECWSTDEEVAIGEGLVNFFEGCTSPGSSSKAHSFDMDLTCDFDGIPMTGVAEFAVSKGGGSFSGRMFLKGQSDGAQFEAEALLIGHRTGACPAPN
ncbi:MAG: hypothetical protein ACK4P2_06310 [Hyphomonas sp.]